jgi:hypothetical protein
MRKMRKQDSGTYRLIPVLRGLRVESIQSFSPYLVHLSHGLVVSKASSLYESRGIVNVNAISALSRWAGRE